ncbi:MAG: FixH family protein [Nitrospiraceae bacterium]|nr:MAG: FixH family protein [Nitrospiraceae bacterium]
MKAIIVFSVLAALTAVAATIVVGLNTFDGTVTDQPYEKGLEWDRLAKRKADLGWLCNIRNSTIKTGTNDLILDLSDKDGLPLDASDVSVRISRSSTDRYDRTYDTDKVRNGTFKVKADFPLFGYWELIIVVSKNSEFLEIEKNIYVEKEDV